MKKLFSTKYSAGAFNVATLLLRIVAGCLIMNHGYEKLVHFATYKSKFMNLWGMGSGTTLTLAIFAEFFCALFIVLGLFTRFAAVPLIITMSVALFKAHDGNFFGDGEKATLFLGAFITILLVGPGRASIDNMIGK